MLDKRTYCANHSIMEASWWCESCQKALCDECVERKTFRSVEYTACLHCGHRCKSLEEIREGEEVRFFEALPGAFAYPLKGSGPLLIVLGVLFFGFLWILMLAPFVGLLFALFGVGYMCAYMAKIILSTARGEQEPPDWPGLHSFWTDICRPFIVVFGTVLGCMVPAIVYYWAVSPHEPTSDVFLLLLVVLGFFLMPMGLLSGMLFNKVTVKNPVFLVASIVKVPAEYIAACVMLAVTVGLQGLVDKYVLDPLPIVGFLLGGFVSLYFTMVEMRILGLVYAANKKRLGWRV